MVVIHHVSEHNECIALSRPGINAVARVLVLLVGRNVAVRVVSDHHVRAAPFRYRVLVIDDAVFLVERSKLLHGHGQGLRTLYYLSEVIGSEIALVRFDSRNVSHMPRVIAAGNRIDAVLFLNLRDPVQHVALVDDRRCRRPEQPAGNPGIVWHAVSTTAPPLGFRLLQSAKRNPRHVHCVYVLVVRAHHKQARRR